DRACSQKRRRDQQQKASTEAVLNEVQFKRTVDQRVGSFRKQHLPSLGRSLVGAEVSRHGIPQSEVRPLEILRLENNASVERWQRFVGNRRRQGVSVLVSRPGFEVPLRRRAVLRGCQIFWRLPNPLFH